MDLHDKMLKSDLHLQSTLHFIETSPSLLHNAPYINTVVKNEESLQKVTLPAKDETQLVYGLQGDNFMLLVATSSKHNLFLQVMVRLII